MDHATLFDQALMRIGGISSLDSAATRRALDQLNSDSDARAVRVQQLADDFTQALDGPMDAPAEFAYRLSGRFVGEDVSYVLFDALDHRDFSSRLMQVFSAAAKGEDVREQAQQLKRDVVLSFADTWGDEA